MIHGDARRIPLADESVQCCVTSPPYWGLRDYGLGNECLGLEPTPDLYVAHMVEVFREVRRVLRDDGTVWLNLGDSFHNKQLVGIPWRVAFALQADGWWLRSDIIWHKPNPMPESVTDRPTKSHEYVFLLSKSARYFYDQEAVKEEAIYAGKRVTLGPKSLSRAQADASGRPRSGNANAEAVIVAAGRNRRTVWTISTKAYRGAHFATFPTDLVEPCVLAGSARGDTVLDPFAGSGTVGLVCAEHGRDFVGIELNPEYITLAQERLGVPIQVRAMSL